MRSISFRDLLWNSFPDMPKSSLLLAKKSKHVLGKDAVIDLAVYYKCYGFAIVKLCT